MTDTDLDELYDEEEGPFESKPSIDSTAGQADCLVATADLVGQRIDLVAATKFAGLSRAAAQRLLTIDNDSPAGIFINGKRVRSNYKLRLNDKVEYIPAASVVSTAFPESIPIDVVYEDSDLLVINKARGMVVHPAPGSETGTLVNAILAHATDLSGIGGELRPGIVHRLDKDTGGLLVVAKNDSAHRRLQDQIQAHTAERRYMALVWGVPSFDRATIEASIGRHPGDRKKMAVITDAAHTSRSAITELTRVKSYWSTMSLWEARLRTGRTHQIRVHCSYIRHPIVGDPLYGGIRKLPTAMEGVGSADYKLLDTAISALGGQALHAYSLAFDHPVTGIRMEFNAPIARPMQELLDLLNSLHP